MDPNLGDGMCENCVVLPRCKWWWWFLSLPELNFFEECCFSDYHYHEQRDVSPYLHLQLFPPWPEMHYTSAIINLLMTILYNLIWDCFPLPLPFWCLTLTLDCVTCPHNDHTMFFSILSCTLVKIFLLLWEVSLYKTSFPLSDPMNCPSQHLFM